MSYNDALRVAIANHLCHQQRPDPMTGVMPMPIHPNDIDGIDVTWDSGERYDPTYGSEDTTPTFEIQVRLKRLRPTTFGQHAVETSTEKVSVEMMFGALLNMILETEL